MNHDMCEVKNFFIQENDTFIINFMKEYFPISLTPFFDKNYKRYIEAIEKNGYEIESCHTNKDTQDQYLKIKKRDEKTDNYCYLEITKHTKKDKFSYKAYNRISTNDSLIEVLLSKKYINIFYKDSDKNILKRVEIFRDNRKIQNCVYFGNKQYRCQDFEATMNLFKFYNDSSEIIKEQIINFILFNHIPVYTKEEKEIFKLMHDINIAKLFAKSKYTHIMRKSL